MTQDQLAAKSGVQFTYISKLECAKTQGRPSDETIQKIVDGLRASKEEREELYALAKRIPPDVEKIVIEKPESVQVLRAIKDLSNQQILDLAKKLKEKGHGRGA